MSVYSSFNLFPPHPFSSEYMRFNVVIPTFNEGSCIEACLRSIQEANSSSTPLHQVSITISDGGSLDATTHIASAWGAAVLGKAPSPNRGRGAQLNHAVRHILSQDNSRDSIFFFLHADCTLQPGAFSALAEAFDDSSPLSSSTTTTARVVTLHVQFQHPCFSTRAQRGLLSLCENWCNRKPSGGLYRSFGDAGIAVNRLALDELELEGGFKPWPLMEDVDFFQRARKRHRQKHSKLIIEKLERKTEGGVILVSPRRFKKEGYFRYMVKCGLLITMHRCGISAERLSKLYGPRRKGPPSEECNKAAISF